MSTCITRFDIVKVKFLLSLSGPHILMYWECSLNGMAISKRLVLPLLALVLNLIWLSTVSATSPALARGKLSILLSTYAYLFLHPAIHHIKLFFYMSRSNVYTHLFICILRCYVSLGGNTLGIQTYTWDNSSYGNGKKYIASAYPATPWFFVIWTSVSTDSQPKQLILIFVLVDVGPNKTQEYKNTLPVCIFINT